VVPPAGEPRVKTPVLTDSASAELGCPRLVSECRGCIGLFVRIWFNRDAEAFLPAAVTLGSPSDNTTPRCQSVARGQVLPLPNSQSAASGAVGRGGLVGARKKLQSQQHFSVCTRLSGSLESGPSSFLLIRWHPAPYNWPTHKKPIVPASPNRPAVPDARCPLHLKFHRLECFCRWQGQRTERGHLCLRYDCPLHLLQDGSGL